MNDRFMFRGKTIDGVRPHFVTGHYVSTPRPMIVSDKPRIGGGWDADDIDPATIGQCTGLRDRNGKLIFEGDITRLVLPDGEVRYFEVAIRTVVREVVSHPSFDDATAKVAITGVVFRWRGFDLFPCVDESGVFDNEKMEVVGNVWDNPELLREGESDG